MDREKYVDESWKESATLEKEQLKKMPGSGNPQPQKSSERVTPSSDSLNQSFSQESSQPLPEQTDSRENQAAQQPQSPEGEEESAGQLNFFSYLSSLAYQAMIFLGEIPHPETNLINKNLEQAKFIIDTLALLRAKTKGNLNKKESDFLNASLYELQMKFIELYQKEGAV